MKIGVFDSGVGGITVLTELVERFPWADFVYVGDTANVPYGTKSPAQVVKLSVDCARRLKTEGVQAVVVACNTASSLALEVIRAELGKTPVFGVVQPGVEAVLTALERFPHSKKEIPVLVLATRATIRSGAYRIELAERCESAGFRVELLEQACPLLVPMIEEGWVAHPILQKTVEEYTRPYAKSRPGVALLACTHYPWIQRAFEKALPKWKVLNSAQAVADHLESNALFESAAKERKAQRPKGQKPVQWIFTDPAGLPVFVESILNP